MNTPTTKLASFTVMEVILPGRVEPSGLEIRQRILPQPLPEQAVVQIEASGVSFAEQAMRRGRYPGQPGFPFVPGYDFVGTVVAVGKDIPRERIGTRVAAVTKTGGWATHALVPARDLVSLPEALDAAKAETVLVNGVTAWQMLFRKAKVRAGQTILVHGASGGVGTVLSQIARHAGMRVIGTAAPRHHAALRAMGVESLDYDAPDLADQVRALAPSGVDAAFDHLGLESSRVSFSLLAQSGSLVVYGNAAVLKKQGSMVRVFLRLVAQLTLWNLLPNSRSASFYNFWGGRMLRPAAFRARLAEDMSSVLRLVADGTIDPPIAGRFPLAQVADAMTLAESRTVAGKVILLP